MTQSNAKSPRVNEAFTTKTKLLFERSEEIDACRLRTVLDEVDRLLADLARGFHDRAEEDEAQQLRDLGVFEKLHDDVLERVEADKHAQLPQSLDERPDEGSVRDGIRGRHC